MRILILGATGFIGNAVFHSLVAEHDVTIGGRTAIDGYEKWKRVSFSEENNWDKILDGIDLVINAIGIIDGDFDQIQTTTPLKLFAECTKKNIKIINISAIGAEKQEPPTKFLKTKKMTDEFVISSAKGKVVYPGIVLGKGAQSTQLFVELAALPIIPLLTTKSIPVIHISQLSKLIVQIVNAYESYPSRIFAVAQPETLQEILTAIRGRKAYFINIPPFFLNLLFGIFPKMKVGVFNKDMMKLLSFISSDDYKPISEKATAKINSKDLIRSSYIIETLAIFSLSFIWLWSGISSLISWQESEGLMNEIGVKAPYDALFIYAGSFVDVILGLAIFSKKIRNKVLVSQILFIGIYTIILSVFASHYWLHPFGPLSKNIPLIALTLYLYGNKK